MVDKVIRDGKVAILISPGFGAGWSTWADHEIREQVLFDPIIVDWVENGKIGEVPIDHYNDFFYSGGAEDLVIEWLPVGTQFVVGEYDGSESIQILEDIDWSIA